MIKKIIFAITITVALCACSVSPDDIKFNQVKDVRMEAATNKQMRLRVTAAVENTSNSKLIVKNMHVMMTNNGADFLEISTYERFTLPKRFNGEVELPVDIKFKNPMGALGLYNLLVFNKLSNLQVSGEMQVSNGLLSKKIKLDSMPLPDFLEQMGVDNLNSLKLPL